MRCVGRQLSAFKIILGLALFFDNFCDTMIDIMAFLMIKKVGHSVSQKFARNAGKSVKKGKNVDNFEM